MHRLRMDRVDNLVHVNESHLEMLLYVAYVRFLKFGTLIAFSLSQYSEG